MNRRGRGGRTRRLVHFVLKRPVATAFLTALAVRLGAALAVTFLFDGALFADDATYADMAKAAATDQTAAWDEYTRWLYEATATFLVPLTVAYRITDGSTFAGLLVPILFGASTAAAASRLALFAAGARAAAVVGLAIAFFPSQVLWSSLTLKDSAVWASVAGAALLSALAARAEGRRLCAVGLGLLAVLLLIGHLRHHTLVVVLWALSLTALLLRRKPGWAGRLCGAVVMTLVLPVFLGLGVAGVDLVRHSGSLAERRALNAAGAQTAFVRPPVAPSAASPPTGGGSTKPSSGGRAQSPPVEVVTPPNDDVTGDLRHLPRGLAAVVLRPYPWESTGDRRFDLARLESVVWYPTLALAGLSLPMVWRRRDVLLFPALVGAGVVVMYALAEGNLGTAYRHRGEFVWVAVLLAGVKSSAARRKVTT